MFFLYPYFILFSRFYYLSLLNTSIARSGPDYVFQVRGLSQAVIQHAELSALILYVNIILIIIIHKILLVVPILTSAVACTMHRVWRTIVNEING